LHNVFAGGLAREAESIVLSLRDEGIFVPAIRRLNVPVYLLGLHSGESSVHALRRRRRSVVKFRPHVIPGWVYHCNLAATPAARLAPGSPAVSWNVRHSLGSLAGETCLTRHGIRANRYLSGGVDALVYNSRLSRQQHEAFGFAAGRGQGIPNGFDTMALVPAVRA
jgi:hypothetical protein